MSDLLKFEGVLEDIEERVTENTGREYAIIRFEGSEQTFSSFSKTHIDKFKGNEGEKFIVEYRKSKDGKWNNLVGVKLAEEAIVPENVEAKILAKMDFTTGEMQKELVVISQKLDKVVDGIDKLRDAILRSKAVTPGNPKLPDEPTAQ